KEAQLKMLRYQLNPHFMFNSMNAISTLILKNDNQKANAMLDRLCELLRYSLDSDPMKKIPIEQEIATLHLYLEIEKIRFSDRMSITTYVADEAKPALIPSMLLQPI